MKKTPRWGSPRPRGCGRPAPPRTEEHTSRLHTHLNLVLPLFFFNDPATTEIYTLPLHDALPIFDSVLINLYRDGRDSVAWHGDRIHRVVENPTVVTVSLGERNETVTTVGFSTPRWMRSPCQA